MGVEDAGCLCCLVPAVLVVLAVLKMRMRVCQRGRGGIYTPFSRAPVH